MDKFYTLKSKKHYKSCACELCIDWNIPYISGSEHANGYIVQRFSRKLIPLEVLRDTNLQDVQYYEAWKVENGIIIDNDRGDECNDRFAIGDGLSFDTYKISLWTKGQFKFNGRVFWIPSTSDLYQIVDSWDRYAVKQANGLKSSYTFPKIEGESFFERETFTHSWDLSNEEKVYIALKEVLFNYCPNGTPRDKELFDMQLDYIFDGATNDITNTIRKEWYEVHNIPL